MNWLRTLGRELRNTPEDPQWRQALWDAIRSAPPDRSIRMTFGTVAVFWGMVVAFLFASLVAGPTHEELTGKDGADVVARTFGIGALWSPLGAMPFS
jgi:uncharacterized protein YjeT (DUF2065 family)